MHEPQVDFPASHFKYSPKIKAYSGAFLCGPSLDSNVSASEVFDLLNAVYGKPNLDIDGITFIDRKTTWTWILETKNGLLACYDFKGHWSIGHRSKNAGRLALAVPEDLRKDGELLLAAIISGVKKMKETENKTEKEKKKDPLANILRAIGAARMLLGKAHDEGSLLEGTVLYASLIDGMLRMALVLKEQLVKKTSSVNEDLIFQKGNAYSSEREIILMTKDSGIIDDALFEELNDLYDFRNRAIHRFFISHLEYADLPPYLLRYEQVFGKLHDIVYRLESEQIEKGVGMTIARETTEKEKSEMIKDSLKKVDSSFRPIAPPPRKFLFPDE